MCGKGYLVAEGHGRGTKYHIPQVRKASDISDNLGCNLGSNLGSKPKRRLGRDELRKVMKYNLRSLHALRLVEMTKEWVEVAITPCHPERPYCHPEQGRGISPCATLSRDDKRRMVEKTIKDGREYKRRVVGMTLEVGGAGTVLIGFTSIKNVLPFYGKIINNLVKPW